MTILDRPALEGSPTAEHCGEPDALISAFDHAREELATFLNRPGVERFRSTQNAVATYTERFTSSQRDSETVDRLRRAFNAFVGAPPGSEELLREGHRLRVALLRSHPMHRAV